MPDGGSVDHPSDPRGPHRAISEPALSGDDVEDGPVPSDAGERAEELPYPSAELTVLQAVVRSFVDPRTRWTALVGCLALVIFPLIMLAGLIAILVLPGPS